MATTNIKVTSNPMAIVHFKFVSYESLQFYELNLLLSKNVLNGSESGRNEIECFDYLKLPRVFI